MITDVVVIVQCSSACAKYIFRSFSAVVVVIAFSAVVVVIVLFDILLIFCDCCSVGS